MKRNNIVWVDTVRTFGIFLVYLYHCEFYFGKNTYELSIWYIPFFMAIFFFVSGYLFFTSKTLDIRKKINSICTKQLWPYFLFCSLIYLPKKLARGNHISVVDYAKEIFTGSASWFIASLIVLQILVIVSYRWIRRPGLYMLYGGGISLIFTYLDPSGGSSIWSWKSALVALPFFAFGGCFHYYERFVKKQYTIILGIISLFLYGILYVYLGAYVNIGQAVSHGYILGFISSLLASMAIILLLYNIPQSYLITYLGRNTLPLYFLSGGCPMIVTMLAKHLFPIQTPLTNIILAIVSLVIAVAMTVLIKSKFKFMLDLSIVVNKLR